MSRRTPINLTPAVASVLATAGIGPSKVGPARGARLTNDERKVYVWTLRRFATDGRPSSADVHAAAEHFEAHAEEVFEALAHEDLVPMFGEPTEVVSRDPLSGDEIRARVAPDGATEWLPEGAVVVAGAIRGEDDACVGCCPVLNFFASAANADRWLAEHPEVRGHAISIEEASAAGRAVFGHVLNDG